MRGGLVDGLLSLVRRRWRAGLLLFVVVAGAGIAMVLTSRSVYRAEARLRLGEPPPMSGVSPTAGFFGLLRMGGDPFANDLELLASRTLAELVVDDAALHVTLDAPRDWHRDSLFTSLRAGRGTVRDAWTIVWTADGATIEQADSTPVSAETGTELQLGDMTVVLRPWRAGMPRRVRLKTVPHAQAARELGGRLTVERTRRDANVVRVRYQGGDPRLTRDVVESAVTRFIALRTQLMQRESGETVDSLRGVAARTKLELAAAESALEQMQSRTGLIDFQAQAESSIERHAAVLTRLETAKIELRALDDALQRSVAASDDAAVSWAALLAWPRFLANPTVGELLTSLTELEAERRELARRRTASNLELRAVLDQITHLDRSLRTVATDFATTLRAEIAALEQQVAADRRELTALPANAVELGRRHRDLRIFSEMVVVTEQRLRQEELRQALTFANVQVIDPPALRDRPIWPRRKLGPAIALMIATATAALGMVVVDRADGRLRTASQVAEALGAPALATVTGGAGHTHMEGADVDALGRHALTNGKCPRLAVVDVAGGSLAASVAGAMQRAVEPGDRRPPAAHAQPLAPVGSFAAAATAASTQLPIVVIVEIGRTTDIALHRAATLLRQADAHVVGAVLVCRTPRDAAEVWT
jgi:uncharacterized protein involved in exopolysaccharide biosynthesis